MKKSLLVAASMVVVAALFIADLSGQPGTPVEEWTGRTILLIGAHPDDDSYSMGTLGMLNANGNEVYIAILTTGNVGTQDPDLSMVDLALIRKQEEQAALETMGIPKDHYINLGYDDGMLEYEDPKEVVAKLVRIIRKIRPDVLFSFDPGRGSQRWHKADHRASAYLSADAARAAMWPLMFQGQITMEGLEAHTIPAYMLYDSAEEDKNTWVDISGYAERKVEAMSKYVSQFSSGWYDYQGPDLPEEEKEEMKEQLRKWIVYRDGIPVEGFRYYEGLPDNIGR
jgi:LmbE family N-acetylglucosaminyl deacetylase